MLTSDTYVDVVEGTRIRFYILNQHIFLLIKKKKLSELDNPLIFISAIRYT